MTLDLLDVLLAGTSLQVLLFAWGVGEWVRERGAARKRRLLRMERMERT